MAKLKAELAANEDVAKKQQAGYKPSGSKEAMLVSLKMLVYVSLIAAVLYVVLRVVKKNNGSGPFKKGKGSRNIEIVEQAFIRENKAVGLVKVLDRVLVLGVTEKEITLLSEFNDAESVSRIVRSNQETASKVGAQFASTVNGFLEKFSKKGAIKTAEEFQLGLQDSKV